MSTPVPFAQAATRGSRLQVEGLGLQIGGPTILKDVDLDLRPEASYRWTDYSPPGKGDSLARGTFINKKHGKKKSRPSNT